MEMGDGEEEECPGEFVTSSFASSTFSSSFSSGERKVLSWSLFSTSVRLTCKEVPLHLVLVFPAAPDCSPGLPPARNKVLGVMAREDPPGCSSAAGRKFFDPVALPLLW